MLTSNCACTAICPAQRFVLHSDLSCTAICPGQRFVLYSDLSCTAIYFEHFKSTVITSNTSTKHVLPSIYEKAGHYEQSRFYCNSLKKTHWITLDFCINCKYSQNKLKSNILSLCNSWVGKKIENSKIWWLDWSGSRQGQVAGSCKHGNELSGSIKCREFLNP